MATDGRPPIDHFFSVDWPSIASAFSFSRRGPLGPMSRKYHIALFELRGLDLVKMSMRSCVDHSRFPESVWCLIFKSIKVVSAP